MVTKDQLENIKLIALDLDGTLLRNDGTIGGHTKDMISKLMDKGVRFSFATGRLYSAVIKFAEELNIKTPLITLDGSMVKTYPNGEEIFKSTIKPRYVKKALYLADRLLVNVALCHADAIYYTEDNMLIEKYLNKFGAKYTLVDSYDGYFEDTLELAFVSDSRENIRYLERKMTFPSTFGLNSIFYKSHDYKGIYFLEIHKQGTTKATALRKLIKALKIKMQETVVMGDWHNDRHLFETSAIKVAVRNAVPEIINLADHVTSKTNDEDGVAEFLEMVYKCKGKN